MIPCKICGKGAAERLQLPRDRHPGLERTVGEPVSYFECGACGFLFSTFLDGPEAQQPYGEDYFTACDPGSAPRAGLPLALVQQAVRWLGRPLTDVLDFGSGTGAAVTRLREAGFRAVGIDFMAPTEAHEHITTGMLTAERAYDVVTAVEVLEHLTDPVAGVGAIARALRPGGLLLATTHLHEPASLTPDWWYLAPGAGHVSLFTRAAMRALAARTGFRVLMSTSTNHLWIKGPCGPVRLQWLRLNMLAGRLRDRLLPTT